jgi:uncharacterized protein YacL (UPF0231 family)|tara:strand:- start:792 stop:1145 length:354 start_codon:yes stop_codon:yes gene_type:complete
MEYDFHKNLYGECEAKLSMGHEAFAAWLNHVAGNTERCAYFLALAEESRHCATEKTDVGSAYSLSFHSGEVHVKAHVLTAHCHIEDDLDFYDDELGAHCGLEDFIQLLQAWSEFINR